LQQHDNEMLANSRFALWRYDGLDGLGVHLKSGIVFGIRYDHASMVVHGLDILCPDCKCNFPEAFIAMDRPRESFKALMEPKYVMKVDRT